MSQPNNSKRKIFDGRYEILSIVGRGADSVVYHARHVTGASQEVAIKVLVNREGTSTLTDKLRREALTLVSCRHKYVVRLDDFHSIKDLCYLSMEYAAKGDLVKFLATLPEKRLPPDQLSLFLKQSLEGLDFVHATGVIHRDLKPENILVLSDNETRLADFGLALLPGDEIQLDELRKAVGSFDYLAPEVLDGLRYDAVSDLYSLGVCFYEAATGKHPFAHTPIAERRDARKDSQIASISSLAPNIPPHVASVITQLIRFSAGDRFQSAADALIALDDPGFRVTSTQGLSDGVVASSAKPANIDIPPQTKEISSASSQAISNASQAVIDLFDQPDSDFDDPAANSDQITERGVTPTEKIDLERIKEIINRDTQRRSTTSSNLSANEDSRAPKSLETKKNNRSTASSFKTTAGSRIALGLPGIQFPHSANILTRFIGVAVAFALLTVGALYGYSFLTNGRAKGLKTPSAAIAVTSEKDDSRSSDEGTTSASEEGDQIQAQPLRNLPEGVYSGFLKGLFPGTHVPMALISNPKQQQITLMLGLEGWSPATVAIPSENTPETDGLTFRSNGLILKFNQESSSAATTGTVIDVVTGDTGTWKLSK